MLMVLMAGMVSQVYSWPQTHVAIYLKYIFFFFFLHFNDTSIEWLKKFWLVMEMTLKPWLCFLVQV